MRPTLPLLTALLLAPLAELHATDTPKPASKPNIIFILADDWGWGDLAGHGRVGLKTPNLDRLASEGTDFHQFTVCSPVCSPSRTAIVTGQYPAQFSVHHALGGVRENAGNGMADWLSTKATLVPRLMKQAGYTTAHFGKWHLSGQGKDMHPPLPAEYGYDQAAVWSWTVPGFTGVFPGTSVADKEGNAHDPIGAAYLTVAATEHALKFIRDAQGKPFFLNLWIHETHHLVASTATDKAAYPDTPEPQRTYFAALTRADKQIGRVLDLLDELDITTNTIVVFTSDNGPENSNAELGQRLYFSVGDTGGLKGRKRSLYLGGVNVPFIVRWPSRVPAGRVDKTSVISGVDMLPTLCSAAGIPLPAEYRPDGLNVLPAFRGEPFSRPQPLFWDWRFAQNSDAVNWPAAAMREGDWGLVMNDKLKRVELYDVVKDRLQEHNLASQYPARALAMAKAIREWQSTLPSKPYPECVQPLASEPTPQRPQKKSEPRPSNSPTTDDVFSKSFERWDISKDGALSLEEYQAGLSNKTNAEQRFKNLDKNSDGKLTREEFVNRIESNAK